MFAAHALGQRPGSARRDAPWAGLLRGEVGDLPATGAAYAAGDISPAHVEVVVRAHRDLGATVREALVDCQVPDGDAPATGGGGDAGGGDADGGGGLVGCPGRGQ